MWNVLKSVSLYNTFMSRAFNGKAQAAEIESHARESVSMSPQPPKLASIVVGNEQGALAYQKMKKAAAERIGVVLEIYTLPENINCESITKLIQKLNADDSIHGIMIQLPLPPKFSKDEVDAFISAIDSGKDVDGMKEESLFTAPVVLAIESALIDSHVSDDSKVVVVGAKGFVGRKTMKRLKKTGYSNTTGIDVEDNLKDVLPNADVLISTVGKPGLITKDMIKNDSVLIDIGAPKGDFDPECFEKARYYTPVPGGIGPVTIAFLLQNLVNTLKM